RSMTSRAACPICRRPSDEAVFVDRNVPIVQNMRYRSREEARACSRGELVIHACDGGGFTWNAAFDAARVPDDERYGIDQARSAHFGAHRAEVAEVAAGATAGPLEVIEIGCGQGTFLERLAEHVGARLERAVGFDPAFRGGRALPPNVTVQAR